jgi:uncharacterized integral membrane protein
MLVSHLRTARHLIVMLLGVTLIWILLLFTVRTSTRQTTYLLLVYGEVALPAILGSWTAKLLLGDPTLEVLLVMPYPAWRILLERFMVAVGSAVLAYSSLMATTVVLFAMGSLEMPLIQLLIGGAVAGTVFASIGLFATLQMRNTVSGGLMVAAVWGAGLLLREALLAHAVGQLVHPFLTLMAPASPIWPLNRLTLSAVAITCAVMAARLARQEERLLLAGNSHVEME